MKLNLHGIQKMLRSKDSWIVIGGAAAAVTAVAVLSGRNGGGGSASSGIDPYAQLPGAPSDAPPTSDATDLGSHFALIEAALAQLMRTPVHAADPASTFAAPSSPAPSVVSRASAAPLPVVYSAPAPAVTQPSVIERYDYHPTPALASPPSETLYKDRAGNWTTLSRLIASFSTPSFAPTEAAAAPRLTGGYVENPLVTPAGGAYPNTIAFVGPNLPNQGRGTAGEASAGALLAA